jgi:anti-sigma-K factor RskA
VLAAVAVTRQLPPLTDDITADGGDGPWRPGDGARPAAAASDADRGAEVVDLASRRRLPTRWLLTAAAAVAVALVGLTFFLVNRGTTTTNDADALRQCVSSAADREQKSTAPGSTGQTTVVVSASCGGALLTFQDVPALDATKTYQLWVISGDQTRSVATLTPDADGTMPETVAAVHLGDTALGVTVEPAGGSPAPTTTPVITVPLSA